MKIGVFAKTFPDQGAHNVLRAVKEAGYQTAQFNMACVGLSAMPDQIPFSAANEIAQASRETGISIAAVSCTYNMIHPDKDVRTQGLRRLAVMIAAARQMGTGLVTLCTGTRDAEDQWRHHSDNQSPDAWRDLMNEMRQAAKLAETHDVDIGIEPELANVVNSAKTARKLIDELGSPRVRIVLDPANLFETAETGARHAIIEQAVDSLADRIAMAHAKDRDTNGYFVAAGQGVIDFRHFTSALKSAGFNGPLITHGLSALEAPGVAAFLKDVLDK